MLPYNSAGDEKNVSLQRKKPHTPQHEQCFGVHGSIFYKNQ